LPQLFPGRILLPCLPSSRDYRCVPPCPAWDIKTSTFIVICRKASQGERP
jgi:hypothetical protein